MNFLPAALVWLRRDLRLEDNAALHAALTQARQVHCVFVFDTEILEALPSRCDRRVEFIRESLVEVDAALAACGSSLIVLHGAARAEIPRLAASLGVAAVFANRDYEPQALARDAAVAHALAALGIDFRTRKDHVIFERDEVQSGAGRPLTAFAAYRKAWLKRLVPFFYRPYPVEKHLGALARKAAAGVPPLAALGFEPSSRPTSHGSACRRARAARAGCWRSSCAASTATTSCATFRRCAARRISRCIFATAPCRSGAWSRPRRSA
jgi:deoxyribodipyrimidine photo-lyase